MKKTLKFSDRLHPTIDTKSDHYWEEKWELSSYACVSCGEGSVWECEPREELICTNCGASFNIGWLGKINEEDGFDYERLQRLKDLK